MQNKLWWIGLLLFCFGCKKSAAPASDEVTPYAPVAVSKTTNKKVFVHVMPWFDTKASNNGVWGVHWKMNSKNPDVILANGQRDIAAHFYPLIGPYASGDPNVIEYQLLLMKLSGIDGVFIDWPGTQNVYDYKKNLQNSEKMIAQMEKVGLKYSIVYEDQNLNSTAGDKIEKAKADMTYMQANYFNSNSYEKINNKPALLVFGPQAITNGTDWSNVFSVLSQNPSFFTLWNRTSQGGGTVTGEFGWINQDHFTSLNNFYNKAYGGIKMASAYPGFKTFYAQGGTGWNTGPTWTIAHNGLTTFTQTLDLALSQSSVNYLQLNTWNDYGEGTMLEPTKEFNYGFLTTLQQKLGVASLAQADLEMVAKLYQLRTEKAGDAAVQKKLDQVFYYMVSLQIGKAKSLLDSL